MSSVSTDRSASERVSADHTDNDDWRLERLIDRLPVRLAATVRRVRQPSGRRRRILAGSLLIFAGIFGFLPILGLWMLPLGLALLADDLPLLRSWRSRLLGWVERRRPHWLGPESDGPP